MARIENKMSDRVLNLGFRKGMVSDRKISRFLSIGVLLSLTLLVIS